MFTIKDFVFSPIQENTYVLYNENKDAIIIDPGCFDTEEKEKLKSFIITEGINVRILLNTHCHLDHVFGNKYVAEQWNVKPQIHPLEEKMLALAPTSGLMYNMPFDNYTGELVFLNEGDVVKLGEDELEVIHVPGHSPGHIAFYCRKQQFLIGGDILFNGSIGRTDLPFGDHEGLLKGIKEKVFSLPDNVKVYSGHGSPTTVGKEKATNPFFN